jgi:hypothetical protein
VSRPLVEHRIRITAGKVSRVATLSASRTAWAVWNCLPFEAVAHVKGDELTFKLPIDLAEEDPRGSVDVGDIGYWAEDSRVCIFLDRRHASRGPVTIFGRVGTGATDFKRVPAGARVRVERLPA